jgi:Zn-dependent peptidase ImmA (M78 family)
LLTKERIDYINSLADKIRNFLKLPYPVDTSKALKMLGGDISSLDDNSKYACILIPLNTRETFNYNNREFIIKISDSIKDYERNVYLAHEIGHLFLHLNYISDSEWYNIDYNYFNLYNEDHDTKDLESLEFALVFLMPTEELAEKIQEGYSVEELSSYFGVSPQRILNRARNLGLISLV